MEDAAQIVDNLLSAGEKLAPSLRQQILALGSAAEPPLLALIADDGLLEVGARGGGWAPLHAIELLAALGSAAAIPRLLELVRTGDADDYAYNRAALALEALGQRAVEPCLAAYAASDDVEFRSALACALSGMKVRDERIYQLLLDEHEKNPSFGVLTLGEYGDPRALDLLRRQLDAAEPADDFEDPLEDQDIIELAGAIEALGGELDERQRIKLEGVRAARLVWNERLARRRQPVRATPQLGRNEPCHCGSGKKYKKCHLAADESARP